MSVRGSRRLRRVFFWLVFALAGALLITGLAASFTSQRQVTVSGTSMENTILPGDRLRYVSPSGLRRGDIVLERVPVPSGTPDLVVRRVIGLPGDHVSCCGAGGRMVVDGKSLDETYLYPGDAPSSDKFSVTLAAGRCWLLGDHRSIALDSRVRGPIPQADIAGRVVTVTRGASSITLRTPPAFVTDGLAPADSRAVLPVGWLLVATGALVVLLGLSVFGISRWVIRRRRQRRSDGAIIPVASERAP
jgi:signal peptidase I